jgi:hypothetical protein
MFVFVFLYCPVEVEALQGAVPGPESPTVCETDSYIFFQILNSNRSQGLISKADDYVSSTFRSVVNVFALRSNSFSYA